jgi:uncharacterized membrane protein
MSIINIRISKFYGNNTNNSKPVVPGADMSSFYSSKLLKAFRIAGVRYAIYKRYACGEFINYGVEHQISENGWKTDFESKSIEECVEFVRELTEVVEDNLNHIINEFPHARKARDKFYAIEERKNKMAYPNE